MAVKRNNNRRIATLQSLNIYVKGICCCVFAIPPPSLRFKPLKCFQFHYDGILVNNTRFVVGLIGMVSREFAAKRYNIAVESVQKETASLFKRDCRAKATHLSAVDYMVVKQLGFVK